MLWSLVAHTLQRSKLKRLINTNLNNVLESKKLDSQLSHLHICGPKALQALDPWDASNWRSIDLTYGGLALGAAETEAEVSVDPKDLAVPEEDFLLRLGFLLSVGIVEVELYVEATDMEGAG